MNALLLMITLASTPAAPAPADPANVAAEVLALERARARSPADPTIREHVGALARTHDLRRPDDSLMYELTAVLDANRWAAVGAAGALLLLGWIGFWAFSRPGRRRLLPVPILGILLLGAGTTGTVAQGEALDRAVVMTPDAAGRLSPVKSAPVVFVARAGDVVDLGRRRGEWCRIATADGRSGWMRRTDLGLITD